MSDWEKLRSDFPHTKNMTYLDNAGIVPTPLPVVRDMQQFMERYNQGEFLRHLDYLYEVLDGTRKLFASMINASKEEVALTSHTSEGINIIANMLNLKPGDNVVITSLEYPSNYYPWVHLQRNEIEVRVANDVNGAIGLEEIDKLIDRRTRAIAVTHVAFSSGFRLDLEKLGQYTRAKEILFIVDGSQSLGALPLDVRACQVDFLACSCFKWLMAPLGTGLLYCRKELITRFEPAYVSSMSYERKLLSEDLNVSQLRGDAMRFMLSGNFNLFGFRGLMGCLEYILNLTVRELAERVLYLSGYLIEGIKRLGVEVVTPEERERRSGIVLFRTNKLDEIFEELKRRGIVTAKRSGGIRVSPHFYNSTGELDKLIEAVSWHCRR